MKRFIAGLIIAASVLSVASCGGNTAAETKKQETEATEAAVKKEFKASEVTAAKGPWEEVLRRDANYWLAYIGLGNAYLNQGDYKTALDYFYRNSRGGYNRAFKSFRIEFIRANFNWMMLIVLGLVLIIATISFIRGRKKKKAKGGTK